MSLPEITIKVNNRKYNCQISNEKLETILNYLKDELQSNDIERISFQNEIEIRMNKIVDELAPAPTEEQYKYIMDRKSLASGEKDD